MLGQDMDRVVEVSGRLSEMGIVAILLFLLIGFLLTSGWLSWWALRRLLGEKGILTIVAAKHVIFLEELSESFSGIKGTLEQSASAAKKIEHTVVTLQSTLAVSNFNIETFRKLWKTHVKYLSGEVDWIKQMSAVGGVYDQAAPIIDKMESSLAEIERLLASRSVDDA